MVDLLKISDNVWVMLAVIVMDLRMRPTLAIRNVHDLAHHLVYLSKSLVLVRKPHLLHATERNSSWSDATSFQAFMIAHFRCITLVFRIAFLPFHCLYVHYVTVNQMYLIMVIGHSLPSHLIHIYRYNKTHHDQMHEHISDRIACRSFHYHKVIVSRDRHWSNIESNNSTTNLTRCTDQRTIVITYSHTEWPSDDQSVRSLIAWIFLDCVSFALVIR